MVARKHNAAGASRGGISKRRSAVRADKDGDLVMDSSSRGGRGGRGGVSKGKTSSGPARDGTTKPGRASRSTVNTTRLEREVQKTIGSGEGAIRAPRGLEELRITGWTSSKAATSSDGGVTSLITWLEKKATLKGHSKRPVEVKKSRVEDEDLIISVPAEHVAGVLRIDGWVFAGTNVKITRMGKDDADSKSTEDTIAMLRGVLARRYNVETKLLDLSALGADPDLKASAIFDSRSTTSKFFAAMMKVLDKQFEKPSLKNEAILSVTLANNELADLTAVTTLAPTLPQLKNLDLSNNKFRNTSDLSAWRRKFSKLEHLVLTNNPIEQEEPDYAQALVMWYPRLRLLNAVQVRTEEEVAKAFSIADLPFPTRTPNFQDEGQIAENFVRSFFAGFDSDRTALANHFYDEQSDFSFSINTSAPRDQTSDSATGPQNWDNFIKRSRNLKKIQQLPARQSRHSRGAAAVAEAFSLLPSTRHPDLAAEPKKWLIECQLQPGLPDPTGQSPGGVDGFLITIHGEFDEMDLSTGQATKKRSFDRTFIVGPGGPSGVRVVNDMLTVRAYGGSQAFEPEQAVADGVVDATAQTGPVKPALPDGLTPEIAEQMILELQKQTSMTVGYAKDCLEQVQWNFDRALEAFAAVKANLPPEAFVQQ